VSRDGARSATRRTISSYFFGLQQGEGQVLQLPLDRGHAEPVRQRGEHLERLAGLAGLLLRRQEAHRAHVVQPVRQLDHQDARVPRHGDHHLADGLRLGGRAQLDLVQLGHTVDQVRDLLAEVGTQLLEQVAGVLDGVVQQRGHQRGGVHAQLGQDRGHGERVRDVGVAGLALLPGVALLGDVVGLLQQRQVGVRVQLGGARRRAARAPVDRTGARRGDPPGDPGAHPAGRGRPGGGSGRRAVGRHGRLTLNGTHARSTLRG